MKARHVKLADLFSVKAKHHGGFVWQAMQGKLGIVGSKYFGRALSSGLVGCYEFGFMFKLPLVVPAAWFLACDSQVILAKCSYVLLPLAPSPSASTLAKAQGELFWHSLYQSQGTWLQARP